MRKDELNDQKQIIEIAVDIYLTGTGCKKKLNSSVEEILAILYKFFKENQSYRNRKLYTMKGPGNELLQQKRTKIQGIIQE